MRTGAIVCFVIAGAATLVAINNLVAATFGPDVLSAIARGWGGWSASANRPEGIENLAGYAVGSFLVPIILLIVGIVLWGKGKKN